jgi:hypothetical protein
VEHKATEAADSADNQTVRVKVERAQGVASMRIGFTDQRLTAHGGLAAWSAYLAEVGLRGRLRAALPHAPRSGNAYDPTDTALGFLGGVLCGADKLAQVAHLAHDPALPEVLGIEAVPSQSTLSRFFAACGRGASEALGRVHAACLHDLPERPEGYTLDLDAFSLVHEDGRQEGVRVGYTRKGLKPCHRPVLAALAEVPYVAHFWLRPGNTACVSGADAFVRETLARLPAHVRITLLRADSGFCTRPLLAALRELGIPYVMTAALRTPVQTLCRHDDSAWQKTEVPGLEVQEAEHEGDRLIVIRQRVSQRPQGGGKRLLDLPGYKFQALRTNLGPELDALGVWRRYNGRADIENRIKELGAQFGLRGFCLRSFWATEAACQLCLLAYNLCVGLQRRLGVARRAELKTLRSRLFSCAAVFSHAQGKPTLKLAAATSSARRWWIALLEHFTDDDPCRVAVESLDARTPGFRVKIPPSSA